MKRYGRMRGVLYWICIVGLTIFWLYIVIFIVASIIVIFNPSLILYGRYFFPVEYIVGVLPYVIAILGIGIIATCLFKKYFLSDRSNK